MFMCLFSSRKRDGDWPIGKLFAAPLGRPRVGWLGHSHGLIKQKEKKGGKKKEKKREKGRKSFKGGKQPIRSAAATTTMLHS